MKRFADNGSVYSPPEKHARLAVNIIAEPTTCLFPDFGGRKQPVESLDAHPSKRRECCHISRLFLKKARFLGASELHRVHVHSAVDPLPQEALSALHALTASMTRFGTSRLVTPAYAEVAMRCATLVRDGTARLVSDRQLFGRRIICAPIRVNLNGHACVPPVREAGAWKTSVPSTEEWRWLAQARTVSSLWACHYRECVAHIEPPTERLGVTMTHCNVYWDQDTMAELRAKREWLPVHFAAATGDTDAIDAIIADDKSALLHRDYYGFDALSIAVIGGHRNVVQRLLAHVGSSQHDAPVFGLPPLVEACARNDTTLIGLLVPFASIDVLNGTMNQPTPLMLSVACGNLDAVRLLLSRGARVSQVAESFEPAIVLAAIYGFEDIVDVLLGVGEEIASGQLTRAFLLAGVYGHLGVVQRLEKLVKNGVHTKSTTYSICIDLGDNLIGLAARYGQHHIIDYAVKNGAELMPDDSPSPLIVAAFASRGETVRHLLQAGANIDYRCRSIAYATALECMCELGQTSMVRILLDHNASTAPGPESTIWCVAFACMQPDISLLHMLLERGVLSTPKTYEYAFKLIESSLHILRQKGHSPARHLRSLARYGKMDSDHSPDLLHALLVNGYWSRPRVRRDKWALNSDLSRIPHHVVAWHACTQALRCVRLVQLALRDSAIVDQYLIGAIAFRVWTWNEPCATLGATLSDNEWNLSVDEMIRIAMWARRWQGDRFDDLFEIDYDNGSRTAYLAYVKKHCASMQCVESPCTICRQYPLH